MGSCAHRYYMHCFGLVVSRSGFNDITYGFNTTTRPPPRRARGPARRGRTALNIR